MKKIKFLKFKAPTQKVKAGAFIKAIKAHNKRLRRGR